MIKKKNFHKKKCAYRRVEICFYFDTSESNCKEGNLDARQSLLIINTENFNKVKYDIMNVSVCIISVNENNDADHRIHQQTSSNGLFII